MYLRFTTMRNSARECLLESQSERGLDRRICRYRGTDDSDGERRAMGLLKGICVALWAPLSLLLLGVFADLHLPMAVAWTVVLVSGGLLVVLWRSLGAGPPRLPEEEGRVKPSRFRSMTWREWQEHRKRRDSYLSGRSGGAVTGPRSGLGAMDRDVEGTE